MGNTSYTAYDAVGNVTSTENALTHITTYTYNGNNQVVTVTDPLSEVTTTAYWADGKVKSVTDPTGSVTSTTYDYASKEIITTAAAGTGVAETTTQTLDAVGNVVAEENALGNTTTYTFNTVNELTATTTPLSETTTLTLDPMGNTTAVTDPSSHTTSYTLNALGQTTAVTDATSLTTHNVVNADGATVATIAPAGGTSYSIVDPAGQGTVSIDADGNQTTEQFDAAGREVSLTDADGNSTMFAYDRNGNQIEEIQPGGATVTWAYNADNQVTATTDQLGRSETYSYNAGGELTTELWKNSGGATVNTITYSYNADGQLLTAGDDNGTYTYTYDALGRMSTQTDIWGLTLTFGYDLANNLTTETDSLGGTVTNTYNTANEITEKQFTDTSSNALSVGYSYNAAGELTEQLRYSDASETTLIGTTSYGYDYAGRTTSITDKNAGGTTIDSYNYTYNTAGLVATETSTLAPSATYTYDPDGQLLSDGVSSVTYDADGNRTNTGYATTTGNELTTDGTWNYSYDAAGNMTEKVNSSSGVIWLYSYDNANRLVEVQEKPSSGGAVDYQENYTYDVRGNLIVDTVYPTGSGSSTITRHAYDPNGNAWADLTSGGTLITRRLYNDAVDALLARIDGSGVAWYLTDNLGSVRNITNSGGSLIDHRDYDAWGNLTYESAPSYGDRYGWTGREFDTDTGLQYNRARWYDPATGRWQTQDPLGFGAGDSNLYRYVRNQPVSTIDPSGMAGWGWGKIIALASPLVGVAALAAYEIYEASHTVTTAAGVAGTLAVQALIWGHVNGPAAQNLTSDSFQAAVQAPLTLADSLGAGDLNQLQTNLLTRLSNQGATIVDPPPPRLVVIITYSVAQPQIVPPAVSRSGNVSFTVGFFCQVTTRFPGAAQTTQTLNLTSVAGSYNEPRFMTRDFSR